mgnify:CR=1 FL=1
MVTNEQGLCLIRTTDGYIAQFINSFTKGINPNLRLTIGGDPGTRRKDPKNPIFHHVRKIRY